MDKKFWIGVFVVPALADLYAAFVKREGTLSQFGRETFRTDTTLGKVAWVGFWSLLTTWLVPHILRNVKDMAKEIS